MVISYHGGTFIKIVFGDTTIAMNPISKESKLPQTRFGADIALISQNHPDTNGTPNVTHGEREPFVIDGPGAYEVKKVSVRGFHSETGHGLPHEAGGTRAINTIYLVSLEGMKICFLGTLGTGATLTQEVFEALDDIDILFIPVGGDGALSAGEAHELSVKLEPHIIIPMLYSDATLKKFLKEEGMEGLTPIDKLTLKKKDVEAKEGEIIVLKS